MKNAGNGKIVYSINIGDIQVVANEVIERELSTEEIGLVERSIGDYIDWYQAIENAIHEHIREKT